MKEIKKLVEGHEKFLTQDFEKQKDLYRKLSKEGQSPKFLVISCCDSRVEPAQIMNTAPGEIFVIRNVANLVPASNSEKKLMCTSAAIEYAVKHLKVRHIIVLGHSQCGGIKALMEAEHSFDEDYSFIDPWVSIAENARLSVQKKNKDKSFEELCNICEKISIKYSINNLMTFPWIKEKCESGELNIHGWYFDIKTGALLGYRGEELIPVGELIT